jgi:filamentous hemagglutinin
LKPEVRWTEVERRLGKNLAGNFKTIDKFENGVATSIKSLDLNAPSYNNFSTLERTVRGYVDKVAAYEGATWNKRRIRSNEVTERALDLAVPPDGSADQFAVLRSLEQYAKQMQVILNIVEVW